VKQPNILVVMADQLPPHLHGLVHDSYQAATG